MKVSIYTKKIKGGGSYGTIDKHEHDGPKYKYPPTCHKLTEKEAYDHIEAILINAGHEVVPFEPKDLPIVEKDEILSTDRYIKFPTAKLAKQKGFTKIWDDNDCLPMYLSNGDILLEKQGNEAEDNYLVPTQSVLQEWLLINHKVWLEIIPSNEDSSGKRHWTIKTFDLRDGDRVTKNINRGIGQTPYEILEQSLLTALKFIPTPKSNK